jgi:hypothetical protein
VDAKQLNELREWVWEVAELHIGLSNYPYFDRSPTEQFTKISDILQATDTLLRLLKSLDHRVGQPLEDHSFDAPLVQKIQVGSFVLDSLKTSVSPNDASDYPVGVIRSLEHFRLAVAWASDRMKPKRGNATNRKLDSQLKSNIAKNLVFRHRSISGEFPAITSDGWAANLLNEVFTHYELGGEAGAYWIRREVAQLRKSIT